MKNPPPVKVVTLRASLFSAVPGDVDHAVELPKAWDPFKDPPSAAALEGDRLGRGLVRGPEMPEPEGLSEEQLDALGAALYGYSDNDRAHSRRLDRMDRFEGGY